MAISKREYRASIILVGIALLLVVANQWVHSYYQNKIHPEVPSLESRSLDSLLGVMEAERPDSISFTNEDRLKGKQEKIIPLQLHSFDPNMIQREEWVAMGLPERVFNGFEKYRLKGGRIRKPEQILKLYNLDAELGRKMIPYIEIDSSLFAQSKFQFERRPQKVFEKKEKVLFDLNQADTTQLMTVFGIGRGIANRIVRYRNNLGGFHSKNQVYEVFALDSVVVDELFTKAFLSEKPALNPLFINQATEEDLAKHPYIRKSLARYIIKYRQQHGPFQKPEDLGEIKVMPRDVVEKLRPYLSF